MAMRYALRIILGIGVLGLAFSGYLSYREIFASAAAQSCSPMGEPGTVLGYPPCIYGFIMYLAVVVVAAAGLRSKSDGEKEAPWTSGLPRAPKVT